MESAFRVPRRHYFYTEPSLGPSWRTSSGRGLALGLARLRKDTDPQEEEGAEGVESSEEDGDAVDEVRGVVVDNRQ